MIVSRKKEFCSVEKKQKPLIINCTGEGMFWIKLPAKVIIDLGLFNTSGKKTGAFTEDTVNGRTMKDCKDKYKLVILEWQKRQTKSEKFILFSFGVRKGYRKEEDPYRGFDFFWTVVDIYKMFGNENADWEGRGMEFNRAWGSDWKRKYRRIKHTEERQQVFENLESQIDGMCDFLSQLEANANLEDIMDTGKLFGNVLMESNENQRIRNYKKRC